MARTGMREKRDAEKGSNRKEVAERKKKELRRLT